MSPDRHQAVRCKAVCLGAGHRTAERLMIIGYGKHRTEMTDDQPTLLVLKRTQQLGQSRQDRTPARRGNLRSDAVIGPPRFGTDIKLFRLPSNHDVEPARAMAKKKE